MADEFDHHHHHHQQHHQTNNNNICNGGTNWWDPSARNRFDSGGSSSTTTSTAGINSTSIGSFGSWAPAAARSDTTTTTTNNNNDSMDSVSVTGSSSNSMVFQDHTTHEKLQGGSDDRGGGGVLMDHHGLQMMGLGLSSQAIDWNQALVSGKHEGGFRSILQEDHQNLSSNTSNYQQETGMAALSPQQQFQWRTQQKMFPTGGGEDESSITQGLSISTSSNFQIDNSSIYESPSPSTMLQGFLGSSHHHHHHHHQQQQQPQHDHQSPFENHHRSMDYNPNYVANYGMNTNHHEVLLPNKFSHFMRSTSSPPKQPVVPPHNQLHFSNNAPFWNASATTTTTTSMSDHVPLSFLPNNSLHQQSQFSMPPTFDEKPMKPNASEVRNSSSVPKKSGSEVSMKRPRNETSSSPLPAFKVRKEKMGDRITSLQQLVSPFGKTDTASVLSEAIEYIKFLHEQVAVLSTPYMKSGASIQHHHQSSDKSKDSEGPRQDLRSRGLCLVPISSTFPVAHETTVDFWTPTFGGTFR